MADEQVIETTELSADDKAFAAFDAQLEPSLVTEPVVEEAKAVEAPAPVEAKADERNADGTFKPKKPRNDPQARIDELTAKRHEAERRAEAAEARARDLEARATPNPAPVAAKPVADTENPEPDPSDLAKYPDGIYDRNFMKDQARYEARKEIRAEQADQLERHLAKQAKEKRESALTTYLQRKAEIEHADPKFWDKVRPELYAAVPWFLYDEEVHGPASAANEIAEVIGTSEHPERWLTYFTDHFDDFQRLSTLPPNRATELHRELGRLEARLDAAPPVASASPASISQAKPVPKALTSTPSNADSVTASEDDSAEEFIRKGNLEERRRRAG